MNQLYDFFLNEMLLDGELVNVLCCCFLLVLVGIVVGLLVVGFILLVGNVCVQVNVVLVVFGMCVLVFLEI